MSYYGDKYTYEFPAGSGNKMNLKQIANQLTRSALLKIFERNDAGKFQYHGGNQSCWAEDRFQRSITSFMNSSMETQGRDFGRLLTQTGWTSTYCIIY